MKLDRWLTSKRLRAQAILLGLSIWGIYIWTIATPGLHDRNGNLIGTDFAHFYTLGSMALAHRGDELYDVQAQAEITAERVPDARGIRYLPLYPPQVSILFAPLANLPYGWALAMWWGCTALIYGGCCYWIWKRCPALSQVGGTVALAALALPAFFHLIAWGQTSALALGCFTAAFFLLRSQREFSAGLALGCLVFKPQLALAAAIVFICIARWKILAGGVVSAAAQIGGGVAYYGLGPLRSWLETLGRVPFLLSALEPRPYQTHCLRTFWSMLLPWSDVSIGIYLVSVTGVLVCTVAVWRGKGLLSLKYSALLLATVLVSPHLTVYDLVILVPAILLLADWTVSHASKQDRNGSLLYSVYILPLLGPFTRWIHVQMSVIAMAALLYSIWRIARKEETVMMDRRIESGGV